MMDEEERSWYMKKLGDYFVEEEFDEWWRLLRLAEENDERPRGELIKLFFVIFAQDYHANHSISVHANTIQALLIFSVVTVVFYHLVHDALKMPVDFEMMFVASMSLFCGMTYWKRCWKLRKNATKPTDK